MTPKATRSLLQAMLCLLLPFLSQSQHLTSKVSGRTARTTFASLPQRLKEEQAFNDSLYRLMEHPPFEHPILQQIERHRTENLALFANPSPEETLVVACAVDKTSHVAFFFTTFGKVSDFVLLDQQTYKAVVEEKTADVFDLYDRNIQRNIEQINEAAGGLRLLGTNAGKERTASPYLSLNVVKEAKTTLEKLLVLDICRLMQIRKWVNVHHKIVCFDADSVEKSMHSPAYQPGIYRQAGTGDTAFREYFNKNPFCPLERAVIAPAKAMVYLYDQKQEGQPVDSFAVKKGRIKELLSHKTNPFVLYRGYLEWQLQKVSDYLDEVEKRQRNKKISANNPVQNASFTSEEEQYRQWQQAVLWERHCIRSINRLMLPNESMMAIQKNMDHSRTWSKSREDWFSRQTSSYSRGEKRYELTDQRGNIMAVVSDKRIGTDADGDGTVEYYEPEVTSTMDYNPYGAPLPGRSAHADSYRYGYNGKENDNEVKGKGSQQDYGMRIYDPRLARFLSVDPITKNYPELTPYQFASNTPIWAIDLDGLEGFVATGVNGHGMVLSVESASKVNHAVSNWVSNKHQQGMRNVGIAEHARQMAIKQGRVRGDGIDAWTKAMVYIGAWWSSTATLSDANDGAVVMTGKNLDGSKATAVDYAAAGVGVLIPFVSGGAITKVAKGLGAAPEVLKGSVKYSGFGGDLIVRSDRVTTILGKYSGDIENLKVSGAFNVEGLNFLDSKNWSWAENQKFLDNAIKNNNILRAVSDPRKAENLFRKVDGKLTNKLSIYGMEIKHLEDAGYRFNSASNTFEKGLKGVNRITK